MNIDKLRKLETELKMNLQFYDGRGWNYENGKRDPEVVRAEGNTMRYLESLYEACPSLRPKKR